MKTLKALVLEIFSVLLLLPALTAAAPALINYQGRLVDANGNPLSGTYSLTFKIYSVASGGAADWTETQSLALDNGIFNANLGASTALAPSLFSSDTRYLGVTVGADAEMSPRVRLLSVPYAVYAASAAYAVGSDIADGQVTDAKIVSMAASKLTGALPAIDGSLLSGIVATSVTAAGVQAGSLGSAVIASSVAAGSIYTNSILDSNVISAKLAYGIDAAKIGGGGVSTVEFDYLAGITSDVQTQLDGKATLGGVNTWTSSQTITAAEGLLVKYGVKGGSATITDSLLVGSGANVSTITATGFAGSGAGLTNIAAAGIGAGSLGSGVIASSIAVGGVYTNAIADSAVADAKLGTGISAAKIGGGNVTSTEFDYLDGVTSVIQTQLDGKATLGGVNTWTSSQTITAAEGLLVKYGVKGGSATITDSLLVGSGANVSTITATGFAGSGAGLTNIAAAGIGAGSLGSGVIASSIAVGGVYTNAIAADAVTSAKILDGTIATADLAASAVAEAKLAADAVTSAKILDGTIATADLADGAVATAKIAADAVTSAKILDATIATADLADGAVTSAKIGTLGAALTFGSGSSAAAAANETGITISTRVFVASGVNFSTITPLGFEGDGSKLTNIAAANIAAGSLGASVIASSIAVGGVYTNAIADGAVTSAKIGTLGAALTFGSGSSAAAAANETGITVSTSIFIGSGANISTITATGFIGSGAGLTNIAAAGIGAGSLGSGVIASSIAVGGVYTNALAGLAVTDAKINDVAGGKITGAGTIVTDRIAAGSLGTGVIASSIAVGGVYTNALADGAVTSAKIGTLGAALTFGSGSSGAAAAGQPGISISTAIFVGGATVENTTKPLVVVSTATTSTVSLCLAGAYETLPTSGYLKGCFAYQNSNNVAYISTETVSKAESWKPLW